MSSIWSTRGALRRTPSPTLPTTAICCQHRLLNQFKVRLGVAERADIVVDFARFPLGTQLYLVNRLEQPDNRGPTKVQAPGTRRAQVQS